jgi:hypothetical protein
MSFGNLMLNHANIDLAVEDLYAQSNKMFQALNECEQAVGALLNAQEGAIKDAAQGFINVVNAQNQEMVNDIGQAAVALETMHGLIRDADIKGGQGMNS